MANRLELSLELRRQLIALGGKRLAAPVEEPPPKPAGREERAAGPYSPEYLREEMGRALKRQRQKEYGMFARF